LQLKQNRFSTKLIFSPSKNYPDTGKPLSEALPFAEHAENMLYTKTVLYTTCPP
jgi:hypothetical protein